MEKKIGCSRRIRKKLFQYIAAPLLGLAVSCQPLWSGAAFAKEAAPEEAGGKEPALYAQSAVLMDAATGRILYEKNGEEERPMASTTKIMTCILALELGNPDDLVEVSSYAASMPDVQLNAKAGEKYRLEDLLYSLMLESHNDSAVAIAEHISGSVEHFAVLMNQKARDIGCTATCFVTPNGLDGAREEDGTPHSTTAEDLAKIMSYCVCRSPKKEEFLALTRTPSRTITDETGKRTFYLSNHNAFLTMLPEAVSGKTGFTGEAGYCYVGAFEEGGRTFTASLLGCGWPPHKTYKWSDMKKLASYGLDNYQYYDIFDRKKEFPRVQVINGKKGQISLTLNLKPEEQQLHVLLKKGETPHIRYEYPKQLNAPVTEGMAVGSASYYVNGALIKSFPVYAADSAESIDLGWCLNRILKQLLLTGQGA